MKKTLAGAVLVVAVVAAYAAGARSQATGVTRTELGRGTVGEAYTFESRTGTDLVVQKVRIEPGATAAWHTHPGAEAAIVTAGTLTFFNGDDPDCAPREFSAGQVVTGPGHVHQGKNLGNEPVEIVVTYFDVPSGSPAATPAQRPAHCPE
jgi:quercetin dioxygenase-like cupin family protein